MPVPVPIPTSLNFSRQRNERNDAIAGLSGFDFGDGSMFGPFYVGGGSPSHVTTYSNSGAAISSGGGTGRDNLQPVVYAVLAAAVIIAFVRK